MKHLETDSLSNQDISSALAVGAYTSDGDRAIYVDVCVDAVAGDGDYIMHVTKQIGGTGSAYVILPKTTMTAASGETAISGQSGLIIVRNGDVLTVYVKGLAGDDTTPDTIVRFVDASKDIVLGATQTGVTIPTVTTLTNLPAITANWLTATGIASGAITSAKIAASAIGASQIATSALTDAKFATDSISAVKIKADAVTKIQAGLATPTNITAGTITTTTNLTNLPTMPADWVTASGLKADAVTEIQSGLATATNLQTVDDNVDAILEDTGTTIPGTITTMQADLDNPAQYKADVSALALEATLTAIKGDGWTTETLKAIYDSITGGGVDPAVLAAAVLDALLADHTTAGTLGKAIADILEDTGTDIPTFLTGLQTWIAANIDSSATEGSITQTRGNSWSFPIEDLTLDDNLIQFVIKANKNDADSASLLYIDTDTGLLYLNGAAGTASDASLDYTGTTLTVTVKASASAQIPLGSHHYGIQSITAADVVSEPYGGRFSVTADIVKAT